MSFNQEVIWIVDGLLKPNQSPEQLLDVLICRRTDGQELSLMEL